MSTSSAASASAGVSRWTVQYFFTFVICLCFGLWVCCSVVVVVAAVSRLSAVVLEGCVVMVPMSGVIVVLSGTVIDWLCECHRASLLSIGWSMSNVPKVDGIAEGKTSLCDIAMNA